MNAKDLRKIKESVPVNPTNFEYEKILLQAREAAEAGEEELFWCRNIGPATLRMLRENGFTPYYSNRYRTIYLLKVTW